MTEHEAQQSHLPASVERGEIHDGLERAEQEQFTRPIPKSAGARVRFILAKAKGSTKAAAERLGLSQRTVQRYLKGDIRTPRKATAAVIEQERTKDWQPQIRALARAKASSAGSGLTITARATFGKRMSTYERRRRRVPGTPTGTPTSRPVLPVDPEKIGRSWVRRCARGMTHPQAVAALEDAQLVRRQALRHEESADGGGRGEAELVEWSRIVQLLTATACPYDPDADLFVQDELAAEAAAAEERAAAEQARQERRRSTPVPGSAATSWRTWRRRASSMSERPNVSARRAR